MREVACLRGVRRPCPDGRGGAGGPAPSRARREEPVRLVCPPHVPGPLGRQTRVYGPRPRAAPAPARCTGNDGNPAGRAPLSSRTGDDGSETLFSLPGQTFSVEQIRVLKGSGVKSQALCAALGSCQGCTPASPTLYGKGKEETWYYLSGYGWGQSPPVRHFFLTSIPFHADSHYWSYVTSPSKGNVYQAGGGAVASLCTAADLVVLGFCLGMDISQMSIAQYPGVHKCSMPAHPLARVASFMYFSRS